MDPHIFLYLDMSLDEMVSKVRSKHPLMPGKKILIRVPEGVFGLLHVALLCNAYGKENIVCVDIPNLETKYPKCIDEIKEKYCGRFITVPITMAVYEVVKELGNACTKVHSRFQYDLIEQKLHEAIIDIMIDAEMSEYAYPPNIVYDGDPNGVDALAYTRILGVSEDIVKWYLI